MKARYKIYMILFIVFYTLLNLDPYSINSFSADIARFYHQPIMILAILLFYICIGYETYQQGKEYFRRKHRMNSVAIENWSKDHLSLILYVESRCVDNNGVLDMDNLRVNTTTHPLIGGNPYRRREKWTENKGTLLNTGERLSDHDDIDCLDDLDEAGVIEIISLVNGFVRMTKKGNALAAKIREFKTEGGQYIDFEVEL